MKRKEKDIRREILSEISRSLTAEAEAYLRSPERKRDAEAFEKLFDILVSKRQEEMRRGRLRLVK